MDSKPKFRYFDVVRCWRHLSTLKKQPLDVLPQGVQPTMMFLVSDVDSWRCILMFKKKKKDIGCHFAFQPGGQCCDRFKVLQFIHPGSLHQQSHVGRVRQGIGFRTTKSIRNSSFLRFLVLLCLILLVEYFCCLQNHYSESKEILTWAHAICQTFSQSLKVPLLLVAEVSEMSCG